MEPGIAFQVHADHDVFHGRHIEKDLQVLKSTRQPEASQLPWVFSRDVVFVEKNFSAAWLVKAGNQIEQCRLAGTVGTDDRMNRARFDGKAQIVNSVDAAK